MLVWMLEVAASCIALVVLVWFLILVFADGDVMLMIKTKIGKQPGSLAGKVVWITGASSGIGEFYAYLLAESGCKLVLSARRREELDRVKKACLASEKCNLADSDILVLPLDVIDFDSHAQKVREVLDYFKHVDILINNAGKSQRAAWVDVELDVDRLMFEVNVLGPVSLTQALLPHMMDRKQGHVVVVSSIAGKLGAPLSRSYTGAKHALNGYFDCLRTEMAAHNVDVTIICPGLVYSNLFKEAAMAKVGEEVGKPMDLSERRMTRERHAYLSCVAIANRMYEAWPAQHSPLALTYLHQLTPDFGTWLMVKMGLKQVMKIREGK